MKSNLELCQNAALLEIGVSDSNHIDVTRLPRTRASNTGQENALKHFSAGTPPSAFHFCITDGASNSSPAVVYIRARPIRSSA